MTALQTWLDSFLHAYGCAHSAPFQTGKSVEMRTGSAVCWAANASVLMGAASASFRRRTWNSFWTCLRAGPNWSKIPSCSWPGTMPVNPKLGKTRPVGESFTSWTSMYVVYVCKRCWGCHHTDWTSWAPLTWGLVHELIAKHLSARRLLIAFASSSTTASLNPCQTGKGSACLIENIVFSKQHQHWPCKAGSSWACEAIHGCERR